jgi:hypothetical protein
MNWAEPTQGRMQYERFCGYKTKLRWTFRVVRVLGRPAAAGCQYQLTERGTSHALSHDYSYVLYYLFALISPSVRSVWTP